MKYPVWLCGLAMLLMAGTAQAAAPPKDTNAAGEEDTGTFSSYTLSPPKIIAEPIPGFKVVMSLAIFPGVPERAACRFIVRSINDTKHTLTTQYLVRTYNTEDNILHVWMIPSGQLRPGENSERIYSCKRAKGMILDQNNASAWPRSCIVDGQDMSPCPVTVNLSSNLKQLDPAKMPTAPAAGGAKPGH